MLPLSFQKSIKIVWKLEVRRHRLFDRFSHGFIFRFSFDLGRQLGAMLAPKTLPRRLQDGSQDEVRDIFRSSGDVGRFWIELWLIFNWCWVSFWLIFDWVLIYFGLIIYRFKIHFPPPFLIDSNLILIWEQKSVVNFPHFVNFPMDKTGKK